jgi:radical SAM protein with 4Fe4S-binding SPASM domain
MDKFKIDSHKLIYHVDRVQDWLKGKNIYPIYIEIGLYGGCSQRCIFCALDFLKYKPNVLDEGCLKNFIREAAENGVKAILCAGEGEPLLYKNAAEIIVFIKKAGMDVALSTNGVMFDKEKAKKTLGYLTWLKISLDAGLDKSYAIIHGTKKEDFNIAIENLKEAVKIRDKNKYSCTIGAQYLLIPQNYREVVIAAMILRDIGVDYLVIKPYSQHPSSNNKIDLKIKYKNLFYLEKELEKYSKNGFQIIFRRHAMEKLKEEIPYKRCLGLSFATFITARGDVYPCSVFFGKKDFVFGNIRNESFKEIWEGKRRERITKLMYNEWDIKNCRKICRLDEINRYLWELKNPCSHVNFI